jgi:hypothetical protein
MSTSPADFNATIIEEFHADEGARRRHVRRPAAAAAAPHRRQCTTPAPSPAREPYQPARLPERWRAVCRVRLQGRSADESRLAPQLKAQPNATIEVGSDTIEVVASEATGEERERLYRTQAERVPQFAEYEQSRPSASSR